MGYVCEGWVACPLLLDERRCGKKLEITGLIVGSDAQIIPVLTSIIDQIAASVLSPIIH